MKIPSTKRRGLEENVTERKKEWKECGNHFECSM